MRKRRGLKIFTIAQGPCFYWKASKAQSEQWVSDDSFPFNSNYEFLKTKLLTIKCGLNPSSW